MGFAASLISFCFIVVVWIDAVHWGECCPLFCTPAQTSSYPPDYSSSPITHLLSVESEYHGRNRSLALLTLRHLWVMSKPATAGRSLGSPLVPHCALHLSFVHRYSPAATLHSALHPCWNQSPSLMWPDAGSWDHSLNSHSRRGAFLTTQGCGLVFSLFVSNSR